MKKYYFRAHGILQQKGDKMPDDKLYVRADQAEAMLIWLKMALRVIVLSEISVEAIDEEVVTENDYQSLRNEAIREIKSIIQKAEGT
jgi:hypothetical protein